MAVAERRPHRTPHKEVLATAPSINSDQNGHAPNGATDTLDSDVIAANDDGWAEDILAPIEGGKGWPFEGPIFPDSLRISGSSHSRNGHRKKEKDITKARIIPIVVMETQKPERIPRVQRRLVGVTRSARVIHNLQGRYLECLGK